MGNMVKGLNNLISGDKKKTSVKENDPNANFSHTGNTTTINFWNLVDKMLEHEAIIQVMSFF